MPQTVDRLRVARERREGAQRAAARAGQAWLDAVTDSLRALVVECDLAGPDAVVVFDGEVMARHRSDQATARESLRAVSVASATGSRTLRAADAELWVEAVLVWDHLRRAAEAGYLAEIPVSLAVDLDLAMVTCWEPCYCSTDDGPEPEFSFSLIERGAEPGVLDSVEALLASADVACAEPGESEVLARVHELLARYELAVPSRPFVDEDVLGADDDAA